MFITAPSNKRTNMQRNVVCTHNGTLLLGYNNQHRLLREEFSLAKDATEDAHGVHILDSSLCSRSSILDVQQMMAYQMTVSICHPCLYLWLNSLFCYTSIFLGRSFFQVSYVASHSPSTCAISNGLFLIA